MTEKYGPERLEKMSDGALRKAIQSLENAKGSVEYAIRMMPEPANGGVDDISNCTGPAIDASSRIDQQLYRLKDEFNRRD